MENDKWRLDFINQRILRTQEEVDEVNAQEMFEGCKTRWSIGDRCYRHKYTDYCKMKWIDNNGSSK